MEEPGSRTSRTSACSAWNFSMDRTIPLGSRGRGGWRRDSGAESIYEAPCLDFFFLIALCRDVIYDS